MPGVKPYAEDESKSPPSVNAFERLLRRFARASYAVAVLGVYLIAALAYGLAAVPALACLYAFVRSARGIGGFAAWLIVGLGTGVSFFVFGFSLLIVVPLFNAVLPTRVKPFKAGYYTLRAVPWFLHNALFYLVRYTFLPFVTLTPFGVWFLKAMGMKIGRHAFVNTEHISDPRLITLGDDVAIGGSVRMFAHYGGGGNLVVSTVVIEDRATIGLAATVMGDVRVGAGAVVLPNSVLLPGSRVGAGETWGGVPARPIPREEMDRLRETIGRLG